MLRSDSPSNRGGDYSRERFGHESNECRVGCNDPGEGGRYAAIRISASCVSPMRSRNWRVILTHVPVGCTRTHRVVHEHGERSVRPERHRIESESLGVLPGGLRGYWRRGWTWFTHPNHRPPPTDSSWARESQVCLRSVRNQDHF